MNKMEDMFGYLMKAEAEEDFWFEMYAVQHPGCPGPECDGKCDYDYFDALNKVEEGTLLTWGGSHSRSIVKVRNASVA